MRFVLAILLLISLAGAVFAADAPADPNVQSAVVITNTNADKTAEPSEAPKIEAPAAENADAEKTPKKPTVFALSMGMYSPMNSTVKGIYGKHFTRMGIRPLPTNAPHDWRFAFDVNYITLSSITEGTLSKNKATIIPLTAGFLRRFGKDNVKSYAALNVGPYYGHIKIPDASLDKSGWGWDANFTLGTVWKERYCIEARYDWMNKFGGLDFSSLSLSVAMKMFTAKL